MASRDRCDRANLRDSFRRWVHDFFDGEFYQVVGALRCGVADGVAEDDGAAPLRIAVE